MTVHRARSLPRRTMPLLGAGMFAAMLLAVLAAAIVAVAAEPDSPPTPKEQALATIHVRNGFRAELMAAEPMVVDPVAFDWGPDGKLWVVEMGDYPQGLDGAWKPGGKGKPGGRVRFLEDTNGDGQYDKSTVFLDELQMPNGVLPWRKGVLVTAAPEIFYAEDTDGDGRADVRKTLFVGFHEGNPQLRINGLRYGLDGWVYCANGWSNGVVKSVATGQEVNLSGHDVRIRPDEGLIELESGVSQYGRNRDDWDNWFGQNNSYPLWHYVLAGRYGGRNPHVTAADPIHQLLLPPNPKVYPTSPQEKRFHTFEQSGRYTSACSAMIYRDALLFGVRGGAAGKRSEDEIRHAFTCEPFHNVVQHNLVLDDGATFRSRRDPAETNRDFFTSSDRWCRPVMVRTGPDGALWVADMYRYMIEHPEYLTPDGREELKPFYRHGDDRGRLYRVYSDSRRPRPVRRLDRLSTVELVAALDSPSGWQRDTAQMLLVWRADRAAVEPLIETVRYGEQPLARVHALATLAQLGALEQSLALATLEDEHPLVRRQAVRIVETWLADHEEAADAVARLADDANAKVRLQVAQTLGASPSSGAALGLVRSMQQAAAAHDAGDNTGDDSAAAPVDRWLAAAVLSSARKENIAQLLSAAVEPPSTLAPTVRDALRREFLGPLVATALGCNEADAARQTLARITQADAGHYAAWQLQALVAAADALERHKTNLAAFTDSDAELRAAIAKMVSVARDMLANETSDAELRSLAAAVLARAPENREAELDRLAALLVPQTPASVQVDIVDALARSGDANNARRVLAGWKSATPQVRERILDALLARQSWTGELLVALEHGDVTPGDFDATRRGRLLAHRSESIRHRAERLLAVSIDANRGKVIAEYQRSLALSGDAARGATLFAKHCATCHRFADVGTAVGPDLAAITDKSPKTLLTAILDPNQAVEPRFRLYQAITIDGQAISGVLAAETAHSVTLVAQDGRRHTIARGDLEQFQNTAKSLMPEGLEKELDPQAMADVISHLRRLEVGGSRLEVRDSSK